MLATLLVTSMTLMAGFGPGTHGEPTDSEPVVTIEGRVALDPWSARENAEVAALRRIRRELERRADRAFASSNSSWVPEVLEQRHRDRWRARFVDEALLEIVEESLQRRDHGDYESFQVSFSVRPDAVATASALDAYERGLSKTAERAVGFGVGTLTLWGVLGLGFVWFDRLTRGYMPWRLGTVAVGIGTAAPGLLWCLL